MLVCTGGGGGGGAGRGGGGVTHPHSTADSVAAAKIAARGILPFELFINRLHCQSARNLNARDPDSVDAIPNDPRFDDRSRSHLCYDRLPRSAVPRARRLRTHYNS